MVPPDVFARDLHQSSINIRADGGVDGSSLDPLLEAKAPFTGVEAMQVEGSTPPVNPEPDWRIPYLNHLTRGDLPSDKIEALLASSNAASQIRKAETCSMIYTRGLVVITQRLEPSLETLSDKVSIGQPQSPTLSS
jgi:hypothetical protein